MKATLEQQLASDPAQSVWVSASAGTGKTRVLVSRMLRLLLAGNKPEKLLCITFTKAAAAEVLQRIQEIVLDWSISPADKLRTELQALLERAPHKDETARARRLLPLILQVPGGMKIMTIHAFCQSVLARFPLEAGVTPGFTVIDESQSYHFLQQAKFRLLEETTSENDPELFHNLTWFFDRVYEGSQNELIQNVLLKRYRLDELLFADRGDIKQKLCTLVGIKPSDLENDPEVDMLRSIPRDALRRTLPDLFAADGKTLLKAAQALQNWLDHGAGGFDAYKSIYLTTKNTPQVNLFNGLKKISSSVDDLLTTQAEECIRCIEQKNKIDLVKDSYALLDICLKITAYYQDIKAKQGALDYEDQILLTSGLLQNPLDSQWVHYKLDGGIDHILVDEAQDTSPAQWRIIKGITEEFFSGDARYQQGTRTLFVVGDEKQSIFSFQNADPVEFSAARQFFASKTGESDAAWQDLSLIENFRSAPLILALTDQVFSTPHMVAAVTHDLTPVQHHAFHNKRPGQIDLWPLVPTPEKEIVSYTDKPEFILANSIADEIQSLLTQNITCGDGQPLQPGDIMVLVRTREPLISHLTKAFKDRSIPVTSTDRLVLNQQLAVQDCLAAMQACLHPQDNYTLACFLKSPFIALDEASLYQLCIDRPASLWQQLVQSGHHDIVSYIQHLARAVHTSQPGHFIHHLLSHPCPADTRSGRHALVTRLGYDSDDILDELLLTAYGFVDNGNSCAQSFLSWMQNDASTIKRTNSESDKSRVQIMTVHASKGLQASVVFLADAHAKPGPYKNTRDVLWQENFADGFLWGTGDAQKTAVFDAEKQRYAQLQYAEYYRLLYVALTRAQDRLVICGTDRKSRGGGDYQSWYECVSNAVACMQSTYTTQEFNLFNVQAKRLLQAGEIPKTKDKEQVHIDNTPLPPELLNKPAAEPGIIRPLRPSRPQEEDLPGLSPLHTVKNDPYRRGQILHKLFRLIPDYPQDEQEEALYNVIRHHVSDPEEQDTMVAEVLSVIQNPYFSHLFTPAARAEVPVVGEVTIDGQHYAISGQIDRLLVEENRVLIVDYKTNRPPVLDESKIPAAYHHQMRAYKLLLQKIYPDKKIETALLWTAVPYLLPISS